MNKHNITTLYNPASELNTSNHLPPSENYLLSTSSVKNVSRDLIQDLNLENVNIIRQTIKDTYRPTYVSYLSKTLPRGPYLQYKYKDQENTIKNLKHNDNNSDNNIKPHQKLIQQHLPYNNIEQNYVKDSANTIKSYNNKNATKITLQPGSSTEIYRQRQTDHKNHLITSNKEYGNYQNIDICNYGTTLPYKQIKSNMKSGQLSNHNYDHHVHENKFNVLQLSDCEIYKNQINPAYLQQEDNTKQYNYTKPNQQQYHQKYQNTKRNEHLCSQQNLAHINGCQTLPVNLKKNSINKFRTEIEPQQNNNNKQYKSISQYPNKIDTNANSNQIFNKDESEIKINHFEHLDINSIDHQKENIYFTQGYETSRNPNMFTQISNNFANNNNRCVNENINIFPGSNRFSNIFLNNNYYLELLDMNFEKTKYQTIQTKSLLTPQAHYVTLADVCIVKSEGLNEVEGWAILCQSVQALQDLFLSDTPSITKVLPLVRRSTVQITTRGRIVFNLTSIGEFHFPSIALTGSDAASYFDLTAHISPEYLNSFGKKIFFAESHVEKMWIYSLGITLRKTLKSQRFHYSKTSNTESLQKQQYQNKVSLESNHQQFNGYSNSLHRNIKNIYLNSIYGIQTENGYLEVKPTLDEVIDCMCEKNFHERCSLMFLLDVISKYFRNQNQIKPFSHIVMEIVKEVALQLERNLLLNLKDEEIGKMSDGTAKNVLLLKDRQSNKLKIIHDRNATGYGYDKYSTIGNIGIKGVEEQGRNSKSHQLIVRRKNRIHNDIRRNTIDVNVSDLKKASEAFQCSKKKLVKQLNFSKSTNYINIETNDEKERFEDKLDKMRLCDTVSELKLYNSDRDLNSKISSVRMFQNNKPVTKSNSEESFVITSKGPEFITKSILSSRELDLYNNNMHNKNLYHQIVHVLLLNGQSLYISCNAISTTTQEIFEAVLKSENYIDNFFLGLCVLLGGDFVFLPNNFKIYKVAPQNWLQTYKKARNHHCNIYFTLFLRIKFFLPTLRGVSSLESRHMLYLQLRKNILEKHILCTDDELITLGGLALQAEIGDFKETLKYTEYFTLSHYLPENIHSRNKEMAKYLRNSHYCRRGIHKRDAEQMFIKYIQGMKEYGYHLFSAIWMSEDNINTNIYVGISLRGIALFERDCDHHKLSVNMSCNNLQISKMTYQKKLYVNFEWLEIENLCFSKHILCIVVRKTESLKAKDNNRIKYKLRMDDKKSFFAFNLASEHHQFYMRLKNSFISLKSISDELNIPITLTQNLKYETNTNSKQNFSKEFPICMVNDNNNDNKNPNTNSKEIIISENHIGTEKQSNTYNGGIEGGSSSNNMSNTKNFDGEIIACTTGSTVPAVRAKNTKTSMLNENRLLKFKEKYLRRTKSTAGCEVNSVSVVEKIREKNIKVKSFKKLIENALYNKECDTNSNPNKITKEEHQNKKNESPRNYLETTIQLSQISSQSNDGITTTTEESETSDEQFKAYSSPNRNRVKMGTRVFSSKILNKSFDNIYERFTKSQQFDSVSSLDVRACITTDGGIKSAATSEDGGVYASIDHNYDSNSCSSRFTVLEKQFDYDDDNILLKNTTSNNLYNLETDNLGSKYSMADITTSHIGEAYVIHSSIKSDLPSQYNSFTLPNETMSESLIEKFNNISNSSTMNERKLTKITVVKERIQIPSSQNNCPHIQCSSQENHIKHNSEDSNQQEIVISGKIKYATMSLGTIARQLIQGTDKKDETFNKTKNKVEVINEKFHTTDSHNLCIQQSIPTMATCSLFSNSQDSIFIDNKFTIKKNNLEISEKISKENNFDGFTLGISIIQGSSGNNVYVKDLIENGPGEIAGIQIGDQIIAVNGISLLNLSYNQSLRLLQSTGRIVELIVSQLILYPTNNKYTNNYGKINEDKIFKTKTNTIKDSTDYIVYLNQNVNLSTNSSAIILSSNKRQQNKEIYKNQISCENIDTSNENIIKNGNNEIYDREDIIIKKSSASQQMNFDEAINPVNKQQWENSGNYVDRQNKLIDSTISTRKSLRIEPKEIAIICKSNEQKSNETVEYASVLKKSQRLTGNGQSRKYLGPMRYPVTPMKGTTSNVNDITNNLSLLPDDDEQVVI